MRQSTSVKYVLRQRSVNTIDISIDVKTVVINHENRKLALFVNTIREKTVVAYVMVVRTETENITARNAEEKGSVNMVDNILIVNSVEVEQYVITIK